MKNTTRNNYILAIILSVATIGGIYLVLVYRNQVISSIRTSDKGRLDLAWKIAIRERDEEYIVPAATIEQINEKGEIVKHSWRAQVMVDSRENQGYFNGMDNYNFMEPWNSKVNLLVAKSVKDSIYNYFGGESYYRDSRPMNAGVLAVVGDGGAWPISQGISKQEFIKQGDKIALVLHPDPQNALFEPIDITIPELINLVREHKTVHGYSADGRLLILDNDWIDSIK